MPAQSNMVLSVNIMPEPDYIPVTGKKNGQEI
jgi:hypothetical protein